MCHPGFGSPRLIIPMHDLTHYTHTVEAVVNILSNGFAWVPNKRRLIRNLIPAWPFGDYEPQPFGMISFTICDPPATPPHRTRFGQFGIVVSREWARSLSAQPVVYVPDDGPVADALRSLFTGGYDEVKSTIQNPDDAAERMAFTNKWMAKVQGAFPWSNLLTLYEYFEPAENAPQTEWRIVHPRPLYGYPSFESHGPEWIKSIIRKVSPPEKWARELNVVRLPVDAVVGFVCPREAEKSLLKALPMHFATKPRILHDDGHPAYLPSARQ
jgi:hypothetical protein